MWLYLLNMTLLWYHIGDIDIADYVCPVHKTTCAYLAEAKYMKITSVDLSFVP